jgi:hypothetical protein
VFEDGREDEPELEAGGRLEAAGCDSADTAEDDGTTEAALALLREDAAADDEGEGSRSQPETAPKAIKSPSVIPASFSENLPSANTNPNPPLNRAARPAGIPYAYCSHIFAVSRAALLPTAQGKLSYFSIKRPHARETRLFRSP